MSLARLLEQATPGPWVISASEYIWVYSPSHGEVVQDSCWVGPEDNEQAWVDAALVALAPDMAQLLIDMADALRPKGGHRIDCRAYRSYAACSCGYERNRELLTRFAVLDGQAKDTT